MLEGLDQIDWRRLRHSYGSATDVPGYIRGLISDNPGEHQRAYDELLNTVNHQGDIMSATAQVVPFLVELLTYDSVPQKDHLLQTLIGFVVSCHAHTRYRNNLGELRDEIDTYRNVCAGIKVYLGLLQHPNKYVRFSTAQLLGLLTDQCRYILRPLRKAIELERDSNVLAGMLYILGRLLYPRSWRPAVKATRRKYSQFFEAIATTHTEPVVRLAAASAWIAMRKASYEFDKVTGPKVIPPAIAQILIEGFVHPLPPNSDLLTRLVWDYEVIDHLSRLGIAALAKALSVPNIDAFKTHQIARAMMDKVFPRRSLRDQGIYMEESSFGLWWPYEKFRSKRVTEDLYYGFPEPTGSRLNNPSRPLQRHEKEVLTTIVDNDLFWSLPTNLFSFFYGLPDSREELRKLLDA